MSIINKLPNWIKEKIELHENCENNECGCVEETMELCLGGRIVGGSMDKEDIMEYLEEDERKIFISV